MYRAGIFVISLIAPLFFAGFYLAFDFWNVNRMARMDDGDGVSVSEYMSGWLSIVGLGDGGGTGSATVAGKTVVLPTELAAMLPQPPEGWTLRPTEPGDLDAYFPATTTEEKALRTVRAVLSPRDGNGVKDARMTYENGPRKVVFELVRYPDFVFTSFAATQIKMELQMNTGAMRGRGFMTVRGMEVSEVELPAEFGLRFFMGDISAQIWVRALATQSMTDQDMLAFFQTLHVPAMNASVIEQVKGMGEVPVIVLASVLEDETRKVWEAERDAEATRKAEENAARDAEGAAAEAEKAQIESDRAKGIVRDEDTGVTIRKGTGEGKRPEKKTGGFGDDGCSTDSGRKVCGIDGSGVATE